MRSGVLTRLPDLPRLRTIVALALLLRLAWVLFALLVGVEPASDAGWYHARGLELAAGHGYAIDGQPTAYWPVGYPAILGALYAVSGGSQVAPMLLNVVAGTATVWLAWLICRRLFGGDRVARAAALLLAIHPNGIAYSSVLMTETVGLALVLAATALMLERGSLWRFLPAGLLVGCVTLIKPQLGLVPPLVILAHRLLDREKELPAMGSLLGRLAIVSLVAALVLLPWSLRNQALFGAHGVISTNDGINLYIGNNPKANGTYFLDDEVEGAYWDAPDEHRRNMKARRLAIAHMREDPGHIASLLPRKLWFLYRGDVEGFSWNRRSFDGRETPGTRVMQWLKVPAQLWWFGVLLLAVVGVVARLRGRIPANQWSWSGLAVIGYVTLVALIFFGDMRFHHAAVPWFVFYASTALALLARGGSMRGQTSAQT